MLGEMEGRAGLHFNHHGLYEGAVRVPFLFWSSGPAWTPGGRVQGQATVMDVANTLLGAAGLTQMGETLSESLVNRLMGASMRPDSELLMGREGMSLSEGMMYGVRSPNGAKYIQHEDGTEEFYDLTIDPLETKNVADQQTRGVEIGRRNVETLKRVPTRAPVLDAATRERLEQLGYVSGPDDGQAGASGKTPVSGGGCLE